MIIPTVIQGRAHRVYAGLFILMVLFWPFVLTFALSVNGYCRGYNRWILGILLLVNTVVYGAVVSATRGERTNFWSGLCALASSFESGCVNITILYIFPILAYYYVRAVQATCFGTRVKQESTVEWWEKMVLSRFKSQQEYSAHAAPPKWFE